MKTLIALVAAFLLVGCSEPMQTTPASFEAAAARCSAYGGLKSARTTFYLFKTTRVEAVCSEGVTISWEYQQ